MRFLLAVLLLFSASAIAQDVTPPVISNLLPSGPVDYGTTSVIRRATTDENATCKISSTDIPYADMTTLFTNTGGVSHSTSSFSVTNGTSYTRYIRCIDGQGNANTTSAVMSFYVQAGPAPVMSNPLPARRQAYSPTVALGVTTDVSATCRYSVTDVPYSEMAGTFSSTGGTTHSHPGFAVTPNIGNTVYLKCSTTTGGYVNTTSAMANFSVAGLVDVPAFPGAEGGGALSVGGRGGVVCEVTNLNASGAGSFKACVDMKGPRTVVFRVSGNITPSNPIEITNPYITIAGQTAPGGGIAIIGGGTGWSYLRINTHDVVIRNIKVRKGYRLNSTSDAISIETSSEEGALRPENVILDHVSVSWGSDEIIGIWGTSTEGGVHIPNSISIQNSMIYEAFRGHATGLLTGTNNPANAEQMINIDTHRSLFAFNSHRSPLYKNHNSRIINNIVYHWILYPVLTSGGSFDIIGNLFKHPNLNIINANRLAEVQVFRRTVGCDGSGHGPLLEPSIYAAGNSGPWNPNPNDNQEMVKSVDCENGTVIETLPSQYRRESPLPGTPFPVSIMPVSTIESTLLPIVGSSRRLDCLGGWVTNRDASDVRIVNHVTSNYDPGWMTYEGYGIEHQDDVGGFPVLAPGTACTDTDGDGMPDEYETSRGLNPNSASDGTTVLANGYTNLEMYLAGPIQLSQLLPASGSQLAKSATSAQIQVSTSVPSSCRWSHRTNADWSNMATYTSTGGIAHSGTVDVVAGGVYQVCNRCYDGARLEYSQDSCTSFSVEANPKFMVW
jgi:pectate lyase